MHKLLQIYAREGETKKAHAADEPCNYSGRILQHSPAVRSFTPQNNPKKQISHGRVHPKAPPTASCWVTLAKADINQQVCKVASKVPVATPFWIPHQHSISTSSFRDSLVSAGLGIFVLYSSKQCGSVFWQLRPRPFWRRLEYDLMLHGSRYAAFVVGRAAKDVHLKSPIATGIKGLTVSPFLRMKRHQVILTPHLCNTNWGIQKHCFLRPWLKHFFLFRSSWFHNIYNSGHHKGTKHILMDSELPRCSASMLKHCWVYILKYG